MEKPEHTSFNNSPGSIRKNWPPSSDVSTHREPADKARDIANLAFFMSADDDTFIEPDHQHLDNDKCIGNILAVYSAEIKALRDVISLLMGVLTTLPQNLHESTLTHSQINCYKQALKYLNAASWQITLAADPVLLSSSPE